MLKAIKTILVLATFVVLGMLAGTLLGLGISFATLGTAFPDLAALTTLGMAAFAGTLAGFVGVEALELGDES